MVIVMRYFYARDSRFSDESNAYTQFLQSGLPPPTSFAIPYIRERSEILHRKINESLIGNFQGKHEEKKVRISDNTGRI